MKFKLYKLFINYSSEPKLNELLSRFEDIDDRIRTDSIHKGITIKSMLIKLSDEEVTMLTLTLEYNEHLLNEYVVKYDAI